MELILILGVIVFIAIMCLKGFDSIAGRGNKGSAVNRSSKSNDEDGWLDGDDDEWLDDDEYYRRRRSPPKKEILFQGRKNLRIDYRNADGLKTSSRDITVRQIFSLGRGVDYVYMKAWCKLRKEERTFRLDRVISILDLETGELFDSPKQFIRTVELDQRSYI